MLGTYLKLVLNIQLHIVILFIIRKPNPCMRIKKVQHKEFSLYHYMSHELKIFKWELMSEYDEQWWEELTHEEAYKLRYI